MSGQGSNTSGGGGGGSGTVTSVDVSVPAFLSISGNPVTSSGTLAIALSGTALPVANGGTGATTAANAITALLPSQASANGKYLTSNGSAASWGTLSGVTGPGSSTDNAIATFSGTGGGTLNSVATLTCTSAGLITWSPTGSPTDGFIVDTSAATTFTNLINVKNTAAGSTSPRSILAFNHTWPNVSNARHYSIDIQDNQTNGVGITCSGIHINHSSAITSSNFGCGIANYPKHASGFFITVGNSSVEEKICGGTIATTTGNKAIGLRVVAQAGSGTTPWAIGLVGQASQSSDATATVATGGWFNLCTTFDSTFELAMAAPAGALACSNGATTADIFVAQDGTTTKFKVTDGGNVVVGSAALATTATDGFLYLPTCAGTPTGNSTDYTGMLPCVFDSSGSKLWINTTGTTWVGVVLS